MKAWNERRSHIDNTRDRGFKGIDFWMYCPEPNGQFTSRCGICKEDISGKRHCPNCYPNKKDGGGFTTDFAIIVRPGQTELMKEFDEAD